jgi:hypothetical protein
MTSTMPQDLAALAPGTYLRRAGAWHAVVRDERATHAAQVVAGESADGARDWRIAGGGTFGSVWLADGTEVRGWDLQVVTVPPVPPGVEVLARDPQTLVLRRVRVTGSDGASWEIGPEWSSWYDPSLGAWREDGLLLGLSVDTAAHLVLRLGLAGGYSGAQPLRWSQAAGWAYSADQGASWWRFAAAETSAG